MSGSDSHGPNSSWRRSHISIPPRPYATWEYTLTLTPPWGRMFRRLCRTVLPHSARSAVGLYVKVFPGRWCCHGGVAGFAAIWLWQCDIRRSPSVPAEQTAVCTQRRCTTCFIAEQVWPRHTTPWSCIALELSSGSSSSSQYSSSTAWTARPRPTYPATYYVSDLAVCQRLRSSSIAYGLSIGTDLDDLEWLWTP